MRCYFSILIILLAFGFNGVNGQDESEIIHNFRKAVKDGDKELVKLYLEAGVEVDDWRRGKTAHGR